jgi:CRISPR-associated protein Cas1
MDEPLLSVASLHALVYCERLFYLEEVERIRIADASVFAGRRLHAELAREEGESVEQRAMESATLGIRGTVDVVRRRDGVLVPHEHKRGRSAGTKGARETWDTDKVQVGAYAMLLEEASGTPVPLARIRYHADNVSLVVQVDDALRRRVLVTIQRARELRTSIERPPVTTEERRCIRCSLAPVCLPEEVRLGEDPSFVPIRLLPPHPRGQSLHVADHGARVGRSGEELVVTDREGNETKIPIRDLDQVVLHGFAQITTQAIRLCSEHEVGVQWMTMGGGIVASTAPTAIPTQRHLRQFHALTNQDVALRLARRLVHAKVEHQLRFLMRATRGADRSADQVRAIQRLKQALRDATHAPDAASLLGCEGNAAAAYFGVFDTLLSTDLDQGLRFRGRTKRPPLDRVNTLLGFAYGMLYREVLSAVLAVGLHPGIGFLHQTRSSSHPLALDLMELFRVPMVDIPLVGALNRGTFDADADFLQIGRAYSLTDAGRKKVIEVFERRRADAWQHQAVGYSLSYARMVELEVRLLEKEWMNEGGLFARFRIR